MRRLAKGYTDTPVIPGSRWRVHDSTRPAPPVVSPGYEDTSDGVYPSDAIVLFDGSNTLAWVDRNGRDIAWKITDDGNLEVEPGTGDIRTKAEYGSCQLHLEWRAPTEIYADSQGRGNSGVFLLGLYEIQILDGYENPTYADGTTASIYGQTPPLVNACVPPGSWHYYDIVFEAPEYQGETLLKPSYMTVFHNGVLVHLKQRMQGPTKHRELTNYVTRHGPTGPLLLQDHGDRVQFRNIWIRAI